MYIVEFERSIKDNGRREKKTAIIVRLLDPAADSKAGQIIAEEFYPDALPDGLLLKEDVPFAALRLSSVKVPPGA